MLNCVQHNPREDIDHGTSSMGRVFRFPKPNSRIGFLSFGWGMIADIDIESETLRMLGAARFTLWAAYRIVNRRKYRARLSYLKSEDAHARGGDFTYPTDLSAPIPNDWVTEEEDLLGVYIVNCPFITPDVCWESNFLSGCKNSLKFLSRVSLLPKAGCATAACGCWS